MSEVAAAVAAGLAAAEHAAAKNGRIDEALAGVNAELEALAGPRYQFLERDKALYINADGADGWLRVATFVRARCGFPLRLEYGTPLTRTLICWDREDVRNGLLAVLASGESWTHNPREAYE